MFTLFWSLWLPSRASCYLEVFVYYFLAFFTVLITFVSLNSFSFDLYISGRSYIKIWNFPSLQFCFTVMWYCVIRFQHHLPTLLSVGIQVLSRYCNPQNAHRNALVSWSTGECLPRPEQLQSGKRTSSVGLGDDTLFSCPSGSHSPSSNAGVLIAVSFL